MLHYVFENKIGTSKDQTGSKAVYNSIFSTIVVSSAALFSKIPSYCLILSHLTFSSKWSTFLLPGAWHIFFK